MIDKKTSSAALFAAALAIPGMTASIAKAEEPPEKNEISVGFLYYQDTQGSQNLIKVAAPTVALTMPIASDWSIQGSLTGDFVTGASPRWHADPNAISGSSIKEHRVATDVAVTKYFERGSGTVGMAYSGEEDYQSMSIQTQGKFASEDKNTTLSGGVSYAYDTVTTAENNKKKKKTIGLMLGLTQVMSPNDIVQLNVTQSFGKGYFSDPYKSLDSRPDTKNQTAVQTRWNHYFADWSGTSKLLYRYSIDSYKVSSHTLGLEYVQSLPEGWSVTPLVRYYSQRAASFYRDPVYDANGKEIFPPPGMDADKVGVVDFTADRRQAGYGGLTLGLGVGKQINQDWSVNVNYENYQQHSNWRVFGKGSPNLPTFKANWVGLNTSYRW